MYCFTFSQRTWLSPAGFAKRKEKHHEIFNEKYHCVMNITEHIFITSIPILIYTLKLEIVCHHLLIWYQFQVRKEILARSYHVQGMLIVRLHLMVILPAVTAQISVLQILYQKIQWCAVSILKHEIFLWWNKKNYYFLGYF